MAQGQDTLEAAWGEVEKAQSLESAWADVEKAQKPRAKPTYVPGRSRTPAPPPSGLESAAAGFLGGLSESVESGIGMVSELARKGREFTGAPNIPGVTAPLTDLRGKIRPEDAQYGLRERAPQADTFWGKVLEGLPRNLGSTTGSLLFAAAGAPVAGAVGLGAMGAAAATGAGSGALVSAGQSYYETLAKTGSESKAWESAAWNALIGTTEAADTLILGGFGKGAAKPAKAALLARIRQKLGAAMKEVATGMATEGTQEGIQQGLQALVDSKLTGEEKGYWNEIEVAAATGALMGGAMGGVSAARGEGTAEGPLQGPQEDQVIAPGSPGYVPPEPTPAEQQAAAQEVSAEPAATQGSEANPSETPNGSPEPAPPPDPLERVVTDMTLTQSRIRNLEGQAKHAKGKGQTEKGFKIDKELLGLKSKLQGLAQEFQDEAAKRRAPETVEAAPVKQPWEMSQEEIVSAETEAKGGDQALLTKLFGEEGAKRYAKADKMRDSSNPARSDEGQRIADEMESTLTKAQQDKLFGIGDESATADDLAEYRKKLEEVDTESPEEMGKSLRWALSELGGAKEADPAKMTPKEQIRYAQVKHGLEIAQQQGWNPADVLKSGIKAASERFSDPQDALFTLRRFFPGLEEDSAGRMVPKTEPPTPKPLTLSERAKLRAETKDLQSFVRSVGGIKGDTPEGRLLYGGLSEKEVGHAFGLGPIVRSPKSPKGLNWEHIKEKAFEAGFFPQHQSSGDITFQEFADALTENAKHPEEMARWAEKQEEAENLRIEEMHAEQIAAEGDTSFDPSSWEAGVEDSIRLKGGSPPVAEHYVRSVQAVSQALGEPPGPPKPPAPPESIPAPMEDRSGAARLDRWIGEKQLAHANAERKSAIWKRAIDATLPRSIGGFLKERFTTRANRARFLIEEAGQLAIDTQGKLDEEYGKYGSSMTTEHRAIIERAKNLTPEQRTILDTVIASNKALSEVALGENVISTYYEVYTKRLWAGDQASGKAPKIPTGPAKFTTFTTGALPRSYSSILEGWSLGNELKVKSFADAAAWNEKTIADVVANRNLIEDGRKAGWLRTGAQNLDGWEQIKHPGFTDEVMRARITSPDSAETLRDALSGHLEEEVSLEEAVKVYGRSKEGKTSIVAGRDMRIIPRGDDILVFQKMPLFAPKAEATLINNVLGRSAIDEFVEQGSLAGKAVGSVNKFGIIAKTMRTAGISDNIVFISTRMFGAQPGSSVKAGLDAATFAPYRSGQKMIEMWGPDLQKGVSVGGLRFTPTADMQPFFEMQKGALGKKLDSMKIMGAPARFIQNSFLDLQSFLYGRFIPAYKANLYALELARLRRSHKADLLSGKVTDEALIRAAAQLSNNVLSGQNWQKMGVNPTAMHLAQIGFLAPDRMTSNLRIAADAFRAGAMGSAHRALWTRMATRYTFLWVASNFAMASLADDDEPMARRIRKNFELGLREGFALDASPILNRVGRDNPSRLFVQLNAQATDAVEGAPDPFGYARRKAGIIPNLIFGLGTGENFFGQRYTTAAELTGQDDRGTYKTTQVGKHYRGEEKGGRLAGKLTSYQSGAQAGHLRPAQFASFALANVPIPFELQAWVETVAGENDGFEAALQTLGFRTMSPSAKRQEEAGIGAKPAINFEELYR